MLKCPPAVSLIAPRPQKQGYNLLFSLASGRENKDNVTMFLGKLQRCLCAVASVSAAIYSMKIKNRLFSQWYIMLSSRMFDHIYILLGSNTLPMFPSIVQHQRAPCRLDGQVQHIPHTLMIDCFNLGTRWAICLFFGLIYFTNRASYRSLTGSTIPISRVAPQRKIHK